MDIHTNGQTAGTPIVPSSANTSRGLTTSNTYLILCPRELVLRLISQTFTAAVVINVSPGTHPTARRAGGVVAGAVVAGAVVAVLGESDLMARLSNVCCHRRFSLHLSMALITWNPVAKYDNVLLIDMHGGKD